MADSLVLRRLLWALTSVVLVVGIAAIPVVGDDGDDVVTAADRTSTPSSTSTTAASVTDSTIVPGTGDGGDAGPAPAGGAPAATRPTPETTAPPAPTTSTTPPAFPPPPTDLGAPQDPGAPIAPRAGLYRYRTTTGGEQGEATVRVVEDGRTATEARLSITVTTGDATITNQQTWRPEGVRTLRSSFAFGGQAAECDWEPDVVEQTFPLKAGATWSSDSSCTIRFGATAVVVRRTLQAEVVDLRRVKVDGQVLDVWAIRRIEELTGAGQSGKTTALALFSPKHGLDVDVQGTASGGGRDGDYHQELVRLDPEA